VAVLVNSVSSDKTSARRLKSREIYAAVKASLRDDCDKLNQGRKKLKTAKDEVSASSFSLISVMNYKA
jgi:hypothetical protein